MPANIIPVPIVQSGTGLVDFRVHNGGIVILNEFVINASGYLSTNGTVSPNTAVKIGTLGPDAYGGLDIKVTPNVAGIIKTNLATVTFNDPNNSGSVVTLNMPAHYIIAPTASPKVFWGGPRQQRGANITFSGLTTVSGASQGSITANDIQVDYDAQAGQISFATFPNIGVVNSFPFGDSWHPSDLPISLGFNEQVTPQGRQRGTGTDLAVIGGGSGASFKYHHSGAAVGHVATPTSGMYTDAYNDTYVFPSWESINVSGSTGFNTTTINPLINYISGGGRVLLLEDAGNLLGYMSTFTAGVLPTTVPFNFASLFSKTSGTAVSFNLFSTNEASNNTVNLQNSGLTIIARSGDAITSQLLKPYNVDDSESVVANFSQFHSMYITSGIIGTGTFKFGIQENHSGYILAGYTPSTSGHMYWIGAQGGSLVTTWALNALFMAAKKWTSDVISGGYGPG